MNDVPTTHSYQVRLWLPEEPTLKYLGQARWIEECRCQTQRQAERIMRALQYGHAMLAVVRFNERDPENQVPPIEYVAWYPDRETVERETKRK